MKKIITLSMLAAVLAFGHDLWVWGKNEENFSANIIYGHDFPNPKVIKENRVILFDDVKIIGNKGEKILKQSGENYHFETDKLEDGVYVLNTYSKPMPWIKKEDGTWDMNKTRKDTKDKVKYCNFSSMQSKALIKIGESDNHNIINKQLKKGLEITPMFKSLDDIKVGELLKFKVTLDGNLVKNAVIYASYGDYADNSDMAFAGYAKSDLDGNFVFRPLKDGLWYLKTTVKTKSGNEDCEINSDKSTLVFEVKK